MNITYSNIGATNFEYGIVLLFPVYYSIYLLFKLFNDIVNIKHITV